MKSGIKWEYVEAAGSFQKLPVGGYVLKIKSVKNFDKQKYLEIVYDIAEGEYKGFYSTEEDWRHMFRKYYNEASKKFFKKFLVALEASNANFDLAKWYETEDEQEFVGLLIGGLIQERYYTSEKDGQDKTALEVADIADIFSIRGGFYKLPEPRDNRVKKDAFTETYDSIPF